MESIELAPILLVVNKLAESIEHATNEACAEALWKLVGEKFDFQASIAIVVMMWMRAEVLSSSKRGEVQQLATSSAQTPSCRCVIRENLP